MPWYASEEDEKIHRIVGRWKEAAAEMAYSGEEPSHRFFVDTQFVIGWINSRALGLKPEPLSAFYSALPSTTAEIELRRAMLVVCSLENHIRESLLEERRRRPAAEDPVELTAKAMIAENRKWGDSAELIRWLATRPHWSTTLLDMMIMMDKLSPERAARFIPRAGARYRRASKRLRQIGEGARVRLSRLNGVVSMVAR